MSDVGGGVHRLGWLAFAVLLSVLSGCSEHEPLDSGGEADVDRPNVLFIVVDTLRADRVHAERNGKAVMPFLAELSSRGTYYTNAISPCSWTKPAMASLFTGVYPDVHGVIHSARQEDPERPTSDQLSGSWETLAERLAAVGYATWAFQTNANLTPALGFAQGYAEGNYHFYNGARSAQVTEAALRAMDERSGPWFLYAHYMDPHAPYDPLPESMDALGPLPVLPPYDASLLEDNKAFMAYYQDQVKTAIGLQAKHSLPQLSPEGREAVRHRYDLECHAADQSIRTLVEAAWARAPETVVVVLSDHGEEFWERGGMGHGTTLHAEQTRVPFIVVDPGQAPRRYDGAVSTLAVLDVLSARLGVSLSDGLWAEPGYGYAFTWGPYPSLGIHQRAVFDSAHVLIEDLARGELALFNCAGDPTEQNNLVAPGQEDVRRLRPMLDARGAQDPAAVEGALLSEEAMEALEAVGYLESGPAE